MDNLGLQGYVPASGRGTVTGTYSGTLSGLAVTIGFKVGDCQTVVSSFAILILYNSRILLRSIGSLDLGVLRVLNPDEI